MARAMLDILLCHPLVFDTRYIWHLSVNWSRAYNKEFFSSWFKLKVIANNRGAADAV